MPKNEFVVIEEDMPSWMEEAILAIIQSVFQHNRSKDSTHTVMYFASELLSAKLRELEDHDWQVVVVKGAVSSTCVHKPGRLLTVFYKPYNILVWQSK